MNSAKRYPWFFMFLTFFIIFLSLSYKKVYAVQYRDKDKKCMEECHSKDIRYTPYGYFGNLNSINLDYESFLKSKHGIFDCVDCHFDVEGGEKTHFVKEPSIKCESCHIEKNKRSERINNLLMSKGVEFENKKIVYNDYVESLHGKAYYNKKKNAPYCTGCHNPHNANLKSPDSTVSSKNLPVTCGRCHPNEGLKGDTFLKKLSLARINGHKKGDSSVDYSAKNCIGCHEGEAVHGKKAKNLNCMSCHKKTTSFLFSDFHGNNLSVFVYLLNFGFIFGAIIFVGAGIGYLAGKQKETKKEDESH
ncbi:MAG: hypothetical protein N2999_04770 [Proteobacteria bacterium]|nr:hypothetical protein [Pseudomonadota bacterium]